MTKVHIQNPWEDSAMVLLRARCEGKVLLTFGPGLPDPAEFEVLVAGRPRAEELKASPRLRAVVVPWSGVPSGMFEALAGFPGVTVHNIHHNAQPVAETAIALLLAAAKKVVPFDRALRSGDWSARYGDNPSVMLAGKTALVLGFGSVGSRVADMCRGLGMKVMAVRRNRDRHRPDFVEMHCLDSLHALLPRTDALMVCLPRTAATEGIIGDKEISLLPRSAIVVNVGRGSVVQEEPLFNALKEGRLFGAGLDVWYAYPKSADEAKDTRPSAFPFHELDNVVMSPHRAGHVEEDPMLRAEHLADLLCAAAETGEIPNRVEPEDGY